MHSEIGRLLSVLQRENKLGSVKDAYVTDQEVRCTTNPVT